MYFSGSHGDCPSPALSTVPVHAVQGFGEGAGPHRLSSNSHSTQSRTKTPAAGLMRVLEHLVFPGK